MSSNKVELKFVNLFFYIFGIGGFTRGSWLCSYFPTFVHMFLMLLMFLNNLKKQLQLFGYIDTTGSLPDLVCFVALFLYFVALFCEILLNHKTYCRIQAEITKLEGIFDVKKAYTELASWSFKRIAFQITLWLSSEAIYAMSNQYSSIVVNNCLEYLYPFGLKYLREMQFIFYTTYCERMFGTLIQEAKTGAPIYRVEEGFQTTKKICQRVNSNFEWSLFAGIIQSQFQLMTEIYWIGYGFVNESKAKFTTWPLILCYIPKLTILFYLWLSCSKCCSREKDLLLAVESNYCTVTTKICAKV